MAATVRSSVKVDNGEVEVRGIRPLEALSAGELEAIESHGVMVSDLARSMELHQLGSVPIRPPLVDLTASSTAAAVSSEDLVGAREAILRDRPAWP